MTAEPDPSRTQRRVPESLVQGLERRYRFVLLAVAALVILDQAVLQPLLVRLNGYAPVINLAGRQRMLSQRLTKAALAMQLETDPNVRARYRDELSEALSQWSRVHRGLRSGDMELDLPGTESPVIVAAFAELNEPFEAMRTAASEIAGGTDDAALATEATALRDNEARYLATMDEIVGLFEQEARQQLTRLRLFGWGGTVLVLFLLAALGGLVLRPATTLIRSQVHELAENERSLRAARDQLELRVEERTRELRESNAALERESREREEAEERSRELQVQLAHAARVTSLGQLATGLAHELNQPLGAIANFAEAADLSLTEADASSPAATSIRRIRDAALRAGQIVRRMRNFIRPADAALTPTSLRALITEVVPLCEPELRRGDVQLALDLGEGFDDRACVDPIQIQQVLVNLVQNAVQAMQMCDRGGRRIEIRLTHEEPDLQVDVCDTGPGFDSGRKDFSFTPFVSGKPDGLGMGLAISRSLTASHGGRLWAANRESGGARVSFALPAIVTHVDPVPRSADRVRRG